MRIDQKIVQMGFAPTKSQALHLIKDGLVYVDGIQVTKGGRIIHLNSKIEVLEKTKYVSRGAKKLLAALAHWNINLENLICCDIGASTGGFTQVLLENKAKKVFAVDVGTNQLHPKIKNNPAVVDLSPINIRDLGGLEPVDFVCVDLSFISLKLVIPNILSLMKPNSSAILLFKPQFEVGREYLNKQGVVKPENAENASKDFIQFLAQNYDLKLDIISSPILGSDGNTEYLILVVKN